MENKEKLIKALIVESFLSKARMPDEIIINKFYKELKDYPIELISGAEKIITGSIEYTWPTIAHWKQAIFEAKYKLENKESLKIENKNKLEYSVY